MRTLNTHPQIYSTWIISNEILYNETFEPNLGVFLADYIFLLTLFMVVLESHLEAIYTPMSTNFTKNV